MSEYSFSTNSRVIADVFARYRNTFYAFCELINNSIQAGSTRIEISIEQLPGGILRQPDIKSISVKDNGVGVSKSDFKKKFFEIGTDVKKGGRGIGRLAAFQLGSHISLRTTAFERSENKFYTTCLSLDNSILKSVVLENVKVKTDHIEVKGEGASATSYEVTVRNIYDEAVWRLDKQKKIHPSLYLENIAESLFMQYPMEIMNDKVAFVINGRPLNKAEFVIEGPDYRHEVFVDLSGNPYNMDFCFINYKSFNRDMRVFLRVLNNDIRTIGSELNYTCDIPDANGWLVYVDSDLFDTDHDVFRNLLVPDLRQDAEHLMKAIKETIDCFFKEKYSDYLDFSKKLKADLHYPYRDRAPSSNSKTIAFSQLAYFIEKEHQILGQNNKIRKIVYPLIDKALSHGELSPILEEVVSLKDEHILRFNDLLKRTDLAAVIAFSEEVSKKLQFLDFLHKIVYSEPAKYVKERSQLHKIIEKELWVFGEQYNDTFVLFSDTSLKSNLEALRDQIFTPDLCKEDNNEIEIDPTLKDITDLFFFNERILDDDKREVMVVELKRPSCRISQQELNQIDKYAFAIEKNGSFSQEITYKIILVSSDLTDFAKSKVPGNDPKNPYLYFTSKKGNILSYVIKWSDLMHSNKKKLSYLGNAMKTKDRSIVDVFENDYPDIDISSLVSKLTCSR